VLLLPDDQPRIRYAILQGGRGPERPLRNDAINLFDGANMADSPPNSSRRVVVLVSIAIALFSILTFYGPSTLQQQQLKMSTIKNVAVIGVCWLSIAE
jgi:hypothetical protein